ncbi:putative methyltransferase-domain-containing protein [Chlamydoabsidia padenii]|nr:putative methyltransferase-domain-containing protein [Chlamydoabsidia padenii]
MQQSLFYIRFLKPPPSKCTLHQPFNIVWTVESDLGDRPFGGDFSVQCETNQPNLTIQFLPLGNKKASKKRKHNDTIKKDDSVILTNFDYRPYPGGGIVTRIALVPTTSNVGNSFNGKIQLSFSLAPKFRAKTVIAKSKTSTTIIPHPVWHQAYPLIRSSAYKDGTSYSVDNVWIIPTWSIPIQVSFDQSKRQLITQDPPGGQQAQRQVMIESDLVVSICEDVEQSIARHVWDCGLVMCDFIKKHKDHIKCNHVIELGSGTGLVGIFAALVLKPHTMVLTDLPDALDIMQQNLDMMITTSTDIQAKVLSWGPKASIGDDEDTTWAGDEHMVDLVLLTDVLYNQGSHDLLLQTLDWLMVNPTCRVLLAYKERNPDERGFFIKVKERQWHCDLVEDHQEYPFEMYWIYK